MLHLCCLLVGMQAPHSGSAWLPMMPTAAQQPKKPSHAMTGVVASQLDPACLTRDLLGLLSELRRPGPCRLHAQHVSHRIFPAAPLFTMRIKFVEPLLKVMV